MNFVKAILPIFCAVVLFEVKAGLKVENLTLEMAEGPLCVETPTPRFSWKLESDRQSVSQTSYRVRVAEKPEALSDKNGKGMIWDSGKVDSDQSIYIPYAGRKLEPMTRYWWTVSVTDNHGETANSEPALFQTGIPGGECRWDAEWIGGEIAGDKPMEAVPARYLRKQFSLTGTDVDYATLYIVGLGLYEAYLNGHKVSEDVLQQMPTMYDKLVRYNAHDVTDLLKKGQNTVGVTLSNGRFAPERMMTMKWFGYPRMLSRLEIVYKDGTRQSVVSDDTWKLTVNGPVRAASEFDGEIYDATREMDGWSSNGFNDSDWMQAPLTGTPGGRLEPQMNPSLKIMDIISPVDLFETRPGVYVIDMGQNMTGWLRCKFRGDHRNSKVHIRYSETLEPDSTLFVANLRSAKPCDTYIFKGMGEEIWEPRFTYHGFRYAEITGLPYMPSKNEFFGMVIHDDMKPTGTFNTSDPVINQIYHNAYWGIRSNYRGIPTDCPQRDERLGWLGDRTTGAYGEAFPFGNHLFYAKWLDDIESTQMATGGLPDIAPNYWDVISDNMTWPAAFLTVADMIHRQYGDSEPIIRHYPAMKKWFDHMKGTWMKDYIIERDEYGDWCVPPENEWLIHSQDSTRITDPALLATSHLYYLSGLMAEFARLAGHDDDAAVFEADAVKVKEAFNKRFFDPATARYGNNTVTSNLLPLRFGMVPEGYREKVFQNIVDKTMGDFHGHVSVGVIGIQHLMRGLTENGRVDLAMKLAINTDYPSWGYMAKNGATTIWELWNGNTADIAMNSGNHVMLIGDLLIWEYGTLAGIQNAVGSYGFKRIALKPVVPEGLEYVSGTYDSVYGMIKSSWRNAGGTFSWDFAIPANTTAEVYIPLGDGSHEKREYGSGNYSIKVTNGIIQKY